MLLRVVQIFTGLIFFLSGLVKAVDLRGFSFKLAEYFSPGVFNLPFLDPFTVPIAAFVVLAECVCGLMLLCNQRPKFSVRMLLGLCIFFAFLTFYSAYFNKVTDCGCFGDAIKLTPWQSFYKDLILLVLLVGLHFSLRHHPENQQRSNVGKVIFTVMLAATAIVAAIGLVREPLIDFRDYKIGTDISAEKRKLKENPDVYATFYTLKNSADGKQFEVSTEEYLAKNLWQNNQLQIVEGSTRQKLIKKGYQSELNKFSLLGQDGTDETAQILAKHNVLLILQYKKSDDKISTAEITALQSAYPKHEIYGVSPDGKLLTGLGLPDLIADGTVLKTIARSNPAVVALKNGKISAKGPLRPLF